MPIPLIVLLWGLLAIAVITAVGRWCRAHPGRPETCPSMRAFDSEEL